MGMLTSVSFAVAGSILRTASASPSSTQMASSVAATSEVNVETLTVPVAAFVAGSIRVTVPAVLPPTQIAPNAGTTLNAAGASMKASWSRIAIVEADGEGDADGSAAVPAPHADTARATSDGADQGSLPVPRRCDGRHRWFSLAGGRCPAPSRP